MQPSLNSHLVLLLVALLLLLLPAVPALLIPALSPIPIQVFVTVIGKVRPAAPSASSIAVLSVSSR
jgi:hypothetical protein